MPLAIELAASRAGALPVGDILAGLSDLFRLLSGGPRTADRQQSLAALIDWSYRLLDEDERTVLQRLAVFRSPFSTDAARTVAAGGGIAEGDVVPLLATLVEKSFVVIDERGETSRFRLLETVRSYASRQLADLPDDAAATKTRHLHHLRDNAERLEPIFDEPSLSRRVGQLEGELPDIRAP